MRTIQIEKNELTLKFIEKLNNPINDSTKKAFLYAKKSTINDYKYVEENGDCVKFYKNENDYFYVAFEPMIEKFNKSGEYTIYFKCLVKSKEKYSQTVLELYIR